MCDTETKMNEVNIESVDNVGDIELKDQPTNTEIISNVLSDEFVNDENVNAVSMLNLKSKLNDVTSLADELKKNNNKRGSLWNFGF